MPQGAHRGQSQHTANAEESPMWKGSVVKASGCGWAGHVGIMKTDGRTIERMREGCEAGCVVYFYVNMTQAKVI